MSKINCTYRDSLSPPHTATTGTVAVAAAAAKPQAQLAPANNSASTNSAIAIASSGVRSGSPALETAPTTVDTGTVGTVAEWEPPRALFPTEWKVRPSTAEEREEFRRQERMRYAAPHKAFTYRMHGYASVVGPVKGIYQHNVGRSREQLVSQRRAAYWCS